MKTSTVIVAAILLFCIPQLSYGQGLADQMSGLHQVLDQLYQEMMPLCSQLISVAQGIAGFAALFYIGSRVWKQIARAEPIDFYPLFRPFVLGFAIIVFPSVLALINGVMAPTVTATAAMMQGSNQAIAKLLKAKEKQVRSSQAYQVYVGAEGSGDREKWFKYTHQEDPSSEGLLESFGNDFKFAMDKMSYGFRNSVKQWMSEVLRVVFEAAALCINTLRTFNLVVLSILGPLVFGLAVFDGLQQTLSSWLARYLNTFLWLPVANIFGSIIGKVQEKMLILDISEIQQNGDTLFSSTDTAYLIFLLIGIVGYFTVPTVSGYIISAGGSSAMTEKVTSLAGAATSASGAAAAATAAGSVVAVGAIIEKLRSWNSSGNEEPQDAAQNNYMKDKLSSKP